MIQDLAYDVLLLTILMKHAGEEFLEAAGAV
jgi:hypothetical protein